MTKNQLEAKRIKAAGRLNEIAGLEGGDAFTDAIRAEASTLETEYRDSGVKLTGGAGSRRRRKASRRTRSGGAWLDCGQFGNSANG